MAPVFEMTEVMLIGIFPSWQAHFGRQANWQ
jgi:hypothetical protein